MARARNRGQLPRKPLRIVSIGGGTGLSTLLRGLKWYAPGVPGLHPWSDPSTLPMVDITAVVTVSDDGGSSGRLRRDFELVAPGDIRNCMVALSEDSTMMSRLFQYRFSSGHGLKGHSFGNLFLTALTSITGDFTHAVRVSSEILAIVGKIYPVTAANVVLNARLASGATLAGETRISRSRSRIEEVTLDPPDAEPLDQTLEAIASADLITFGPGSLFTSVVPNLLVRGIPEAIARSRAVKAYFANLMWQPGETSDFTVGDHVEAIHRHARRSLLDYVVVNTGLMRPALLRRYAKERARPVELDRERIRSLGVQVLGADLLEQTDMIRHDPAKTAAIVVKLAKAGHRRAALREQRRRR